MTEPRPRQWHTIYGRTLGEAETAYDVVVSGPGTVARVIAVATMHTTGGSFFGFFRWFWGLHVGTAEPDVLAPELDETGWMVHRGVQEPNTSSATHFTKPPPNFVDTEGMRTLAADESLRVACSVVPPGDPANFQWHVRALLIEP